MLVTLFLYSRYCVVLLMEYILSPILGEKTKELRHQKVVQALCSWKLIQVCEIQGQEMALLERQILSLLYLKQQDQFKFLPSSPLFQLGS